MLKVLITIDAETHPISSGWKQDRLSADMKRDLYGEIDGRSVGLHYQLGTLARQGLKANFMLESLFSAVPEVGAEPLKDAVRVIAAAGHDIQIHPHPEWIKYIPDIGVPFRSHLLRAYPLSEQESIVRFSKTLLERAGAPSPVAFRAGGFAANGDTLIALRRCGVKYDSSFNRCYRYEKSQLPSPRSYGHVTEYDGVLELPVTVFRDYGGHFRSAQLCASSSAEMTHALVRAEALGWDFFVIVSHSFEMITRRRHATKPPIIRQEVVERFERLCEFLSTNRERFVTVKFSELDSLIDRGSPDRSSACIKGRIVNTAQRMFEQAVSRIQTR